MTILPRRDLFDLPDGVIYLDGNSLGALPKHAKARIDAAITEEWGTMLIRGWNAAGWYTLPARVGERLAKLIGAPEGTVTCCDSTSVNLFKVLTSALSLTDRKVVLSDSGNFPTDLYVAQGALNALDKGHSLNVVAPEAVMDAIDESVGVVMLTQVDYRTGRLHDMASITAKAHAAGALMISRFDYYSFKEFGSRRQVSFTYVILVPMVFVLIALNPPLMLFFFAGTFTLHGPLMWVWRKVRGKPGTVVAGNAPTQDDQS